jgi:hypothetical protein
MALAVNILLEELEVVLRKARERQVPDDLLEFFLEPALGQAVLDRVGVGFPQLGIAFRSLTQMCSRPSMKRTRTRRSLRLQACEPVSYSSCFAYQKQPGPHRQSSQSIGTCSSGQHRALGNSEPSMALVLAPCSS